MTFKGLFLPLIAVLLTGAMGDGRNAPPPVALPEGAAVPGAGLNRPGTREVLPEAPATGPAATALRILPAAEADPLAARGITGPLSPAEFTATVADGLATDIAHAAAGRDSAWKEGMWSVASARKTGRVVVTHEAQTQLGMGAEIAAFLSQELYHELEAPVIRVTGNDVPYPPSRVEEHFLPDLDRILDGVDRALAY